MCRRRGVPFRRFGCRFARVLPAEEGRAQVFYGIGGKRGGRRFSPGGFWGCSGVRWVDFFTKSSICICRFGIFVYLCTRLQVGRVLLVPAVQGSLAQLVQSVCLTSRGSGVRIPQLPQFFPQGAGKDGKRKGGRVKILGRKTRYSLFRKKRHIDLIGSLAQLVQSVCLTSRGSGVRIPQLPQAESPAADGCGTFFMAFYARGDFSQAAFFFAMLFSFGEVLPRCTFPSTFQPLAPCVPPVVFSLSSSRCLSLQKIRFMNGCAFNFNPLTFEAAFFGLICGIRLAEPSGGPPVGLIFAPGVAKTPL